MRRSTSPAPGGGLTSSVYRDSSTPLWHGNLGLLKQVNFPLTACSPAARQEPIPISDDQTLSQSAFIRPNTGNPVTKIWHHASQIHGPVRSRRWRPFWLENPQWASLPASTRSQKMQMEPCLGFVILCGKLKKHNLHNDFRFLEISSFWSILAASWLCLAGLKSFI